MANKRYYSYQIIGLNILCELPHEIEILKEADDFLHPLYGDAENLYGSAENPISYLIRMRSVSALPCVPQNAVQNDGRYFSYIDGERVTFLRAETNALPYACAIYRGDGRTVDLQYLPGNEQKVHYSRQISDLIGMETLFLQSDAFILHAAFIACQGQGVLFTAPSGTGKSTQANLWEQFKGADIINGDRAGLRLSEGSWTAYGLPYAGSSGIYRNESAPLKALVVLRQAKENRIRRLRTSEAIRAIYPEVFIHRWDPDFASRALTLIEKMIAATPVYILECLPDEDAVNITYQTIFQ